MSRLKMIEKLKKIETITLTSNKLKQIAPLTYKSIENIFVKKIFDKNMYNDTEELEIFQDGKYFIDIHFADVITYTVGKDRQQLDEEPSWTENNWDDIDDEVLNNFIKAREQK